MKPGARRIAVPATSLVKLALGIVSNVSFKRGNETFIVVRKDDPLSVDQVKDYLVLAFRDQEGEDES